MAIARIGLPDTIHRGEVIEVKLLIQHPMETGFRRDARGERVPRNAVHSVRVTYNGREVLRATLSTGIAANPYLRFFTRAEDSGRLEVWWLDDDEVSGTAQAAITVSA